MKEGICFIDTDVFVNALVPLDKEKNKSSRILLEKIEHGVLTAVTDFLVLIEAFHILEKCKDRDIATDMVRNLLSLPNITFIAVDSVTFFESLKRTAKYNLKSNDLVHYTVALLHNATFFYSYDNDFNDLEIKRIEP